MILFQSGLETSPDGLGDLGAIVNGNWRVINDYFSKSAGKTASQAGTTVTASAAIFETDDVGATIRFADGTVRTIASISSSTVAEVTVSGTVASQEFDLYRTTETKIDAVMRMLTKQLRMTGADSGKLYVWDDAAKRLIPISALTVDDGAKTFTFDNEANLVFGTDDGTQIGTATNQKLAFWGATPVVQPASANQASLSLASDLTGADSVSKADVEANFAAVQTLVNQIRADLVAAGLIKGSA